jgi:Rho family, other
MDAELSDFTDDTDLIMLCFSVENRKSFENIGSKWIEEIKTKLMDVKIVLVALKCDLREQENADDAEATPATGPDGRPIEKEPPISYDEGLEVARHIQAVRYLECSAIHNRGVNEAFTEAARVALRVRKDEEESKCAIM